ncbi:hypothetical protein ACFSYD_17535 [Paracoccus aerius]
MAAVIRARGLAGQGELALRPVPMTWAAAVPSMMRLVAMFQSLRLPPEARSRAMAYSAKMFFSVSLFSASSFRSAKTWL